MAYYNPPPELGSMIPYMQQDFNYCLNVAYEHHWIFARAPLNYLDTGEIFCRNVLAENQVCSQCQSNGTVWE